MRRKDATTRRTQRTRFDARMEKNHSTLPEFFIFHSSFIIMHRLRILIVFWARTLEDEICQLLRKSSNSQGKAHSASVFFGVTSLRPLRPQRLCVLCVLSVSASHRRHVHHIYRFVAGAYALGETRRSGDSELMHEMAKSAKKGRRDAEDAEVAGLA